MPLTKPKMPKLPRSRPCSESFVLLVRFCYSSQAVGNDLLFLFLGRSVFLHCVVEMGDLAANHRGDTPLNMDVKLTGISGMPLNNCTKTPKITCETSKKKKKAGVLQNPLKNLVCSATH